MWPGMKRLRLVIFLGCIPSLMLASPSVRHLAHIAEWHHLGFIGGLAFREEDGRGGDDHVSTGSILPPADDACPLAPSLLPFVHTFAISDLCGPKIKGNVSGV